MPENLALLPEEIRADFAQRLHRRMLAMEASAKCGCGSSNDAHLPGCEKHGWMSARRVVELMLGDCNGEEEDESVRQN